MFQVKPKNDERSKESVESFLVPCNQFTTLVINRYGELSMELPDINFKKFDFILVGSYSWLSSSVFDLLLLLEVAPSGSHSSGPRPLLPGEVKILSSWNHLITVFFA